MKRTLSKRHDFEPEPPLKDEQSFEEVSGDGNAAIRLRMMNRNGHWFSYPYAYMGLIKCVSPNSVTIYCHCGDIDHIKIRGRGLIEIARLLDIQRLSLIRESSRPEFDPGSVIIESIELKSAK